MSNNSKIDLIDRVQKRCSMYDGLARSDAVEAVRKPGDKDIQARARERVAVADALGAAATDIINAIHALWPDDKP